MIEEFHVSGTHFEIGLAIGRHFADRIHQAYDNYAFLNALHDFHETDAGQNIYAEMLEIHQQHYPQYVQELEGIAQGSHRPFTDVLLVNLRGEYRGFIAHSQADELRGCSDCSLLNENFALIGHNEDGSPAFREHMYFIHAEIHDEPAFTACSYPGFLCGNAFGFNETGICFSVDNMRPRNIQIGIARHFLARSLLDSRSIDEAIQNVTVDGRASGFSYTIGSIGERRIVQVEVTSEQSHVKEITDANFHANHVLEIADAEQTIAASSAARVSRAGTMMQQPVLDADSVLAILGDSDDPEFPIYRTAKSPDPTETFCTALFDLDKQEMRVYSGHPVHQKESVTIFTM